MGSVCRGGESNLIRKGERRNPFLPTSKKEMEALGWENVDIILFTGDAYIDHPSFGASVIARILEREGYRVAVVPQPNWRDDLRDFKKLGRPRLFFGVTSGAMDSMVNHYTAAKRLRSDDAYTPNGVAGMRPDYAVVVYSTILKQLWPDVPVVIGGVEASLRRVVHYDYWQDKLLPSVLVSSGADYLIYGMGEKPVVKLAEHIKRHKIRGGVWNVPYEERDMASGGAYDMSDQFQIAWYDKFAMNYPDIPGTQRLHSFEQCLKSKRAFGENFNVIELNANLLEPARLIEPCGEGAVIVNPQYPPASEEEMDSYSDLPYTKLPHPRYKGKKIPAYEMIKFSVNTHRGCFGGCSFCTIAAHQGRHIQSRSEESVVKEIEALRSLPDFAGNVSDVGGPTANMYGMHGVKREMCKKCIRKSCLFPNLCRNLNHSHERLLTLYKKISLIEGVKHAYIGSGIRYDLFLNSDGFLKEGCSADYFEELVINHTSGRLKVAPEHTERHVLDLMNKPGFILFERLKREFDKVIRRHGLKFQIVPYFISSHPGCTMADMKHLSEKTILQGVFMDQVQDFTPTPMTLSSAIYYTEMDLKSWRPVYVEKNFKRRIEQKSYFFKKY
jgi:uncharacterized radical SAM protein YgiQ